MNFFCSLTVGVDMHIDRHRYARTPLYWNKLMDRALLNIHFFFPPQGPPWAKGPFRASVFSKLHDLPC